MRFLFGLLWLVCFAVSACSMDNKHSFCLGMRNCLDERVRIKITGSCQNSKNPQTFLIKTLEPDQLISEDIQSEDLLIKFSVIKKGVVISWQDSYHKYDKTSSSIFCMIDE